MIQLNLFIRDTNRLNMSTWKKIFYASSNQKRAEVAILISDKVDLKLKSLQETKKDIIY